MHDKLVLRYAELPRFVRKPFWRFWHNLIQKREGNEGSVTFLNYGYAALNGESATVQLTDEDQHERYPIQLYHRAVRDQDLSNRRVLEVGCGRGGGASYISRTFRPARYVGLDLASKNIDFCNEFHGSDSLSFVTGDAQKLPFEDNSFDAVVNVESSRCYSDIPKFFSEVKRVLTDNGTFLLTDMRWKEDLPILRKQLSAAGFLAHEEENITENVVRALDLDDHRRRSLISEKIPKFLERAFGEFAGVKGSGRYLEFAGGRMQYVSLLLTPA